MIAPSAERPGPRFPFDGFFIPPGIRPDRYARRKINGLVVRFPVLTPALCAEIADRLREAQESHLAAMPTKSLLDAAEVVVARWLNDRDAVRIEAETILPMVTGLSPSMVRLGLSRMLEDLRTDSLRRILERDLGDIRYLEEFRPLPEAPHRFRRAMGYRLTTQIFSGNIPGLPAWEILLTLLLKSACLCKVSSEEPVFAPLFARTLAEVDPRLADGLAVIGWAGGSPRARKIEETIYGRSDLVIATGSDAAVSAVHRSMARTHPLCRFIGYGHRLSLGLIGREALAERSGIKRAAKRAALDIAMYDQQGCLSPHVLYVETGGGCSAREFARALARALDHLERELPRGAVETRVSARLRLIRSGQEVREAVGKKVHVYGSPKGTVWTVIYESDPAFVPSPLYRTVRVKPVRDLRKVIPLLKDWRTHLQAVGLLVADSRLMELAEALGRAGAHRICPLGSMQRPPSGWAQDGRRPVVERIRWVDLETP